MMMMICMLIKRKQGTRHLHKTTMCILVLIDTFTQQCAFWISPAHRRAAGERIFDATEADADWDQRRGRKLGQVHCAALLVELAVSADGEAVDKQGLPSQLTARQWTGQRRYGSPIPKSPPVPALVFPRTLRGWCLALIVVQNSSLILVTSYSRTLTPAYLPTVAVFLSECIKLVAAVGLLTFEVKSLRLALSQVAALAFEDGAQLSRPSAVGLTLG